MPSLILRYIRSMQTKKQSINLQHQLYQCCIHHQAIDDSVIPPYYAMFLLSFKKLFFCQCLPQRIDRSVLQLSNEAWAQCDQIGRVFALWAIIQSRWQQLFYPICLHCQAIFVTVSKSFIFLVKSYSGNFYRHLAIFIWSHCMSTYQKTASFKCDCILFAPTVAHLMGPIT